MSANEVLGYVLAIAECVTRHGRPRLQGARLTAWELTRAGVRADGGEWQTGGVGGVSGKMGELGL